MRHYVSSSTAELVRLLVACSLALAPLAAASFVTCVDELAPLAPSSRLVDIDLSASTDGEDVGVVGVEVASFVDAEAVFALDATLVPACAIRALR
jgi:hypothetical protein